MNYHLFVSNQPKSSRAKKRQEKKKRGQAIQSKKISKFKARHPKNDQFSRIDVENHVDTLDRDTSFLRNLSVRSTAQPSTSTSTSTNVDKKKIGLDYENEKKLFAEKPELFEKRMIVIDGSNIAYA